MLIAPGKRKFKLKRLPEPIVVKETGLKYEFVAPELQSAPKCQDCKNGWLFIAYGKKDGIWDVYSFPCKCSFPGGYEFWQLANVGLYANRPVDAQYAETDLPGHVFVHPVHTAEKLRAINRMVKYLTENMALGEEVPF